MSGKRYGKRTVAEAVQLLDVYASQFAAVGQFSPREVGCMLNVGTAAGVLSRRALRLCRAISGRDPVWIGDCAAEAAQRLREGWRP